MSKSLARSSGFSVPSRKEATEYYCVLQCRAHRDCRAAVKLLRCGNSTVALAASIERHGVDRGAGCMLDIASPLERVAATEV